MKKKRFWIGLIIVVVVAVGVDPDATEAGVSLSDIAVEQARINLDVAQAKLDDLWSWEPDAGAIAQAEANLAAANASFSAAAGQESASSNGVTIQQINLDGAQRTLADAQAAYNTAYDPGREWEFGVQRMADTVLTAPMDGIVMSIAASVGENVSASEFITLADLETPLLEVYLDEADMNMVGVGYAVEAVFDALPDETFVGEVVQVDPQLANVGGVTAVHALVQFDSFAKPQTLPVGMNATVEVIGGQAQNAVIVPVEALRELSPNEYAVFVMENGEPQLRLVEVGIMDFSFAEILSGLEAGEEVTTGIVQTQ